MPPLQPIKTYVPQQTQTGPNRERGDHVEQYKLPTLIRVFIWLLVFRSVVNLIFGLTLGLAPDTDAANYILANFDPWPKAVSAEAVFYITALLYGVMAWRWYSRDWKVRWVVMFMSGATAIKLLINYAANQAAGNPTPMSPGQEAALFISVGVNFLICGYLAFYPGMAQAFKETPWD
ncbi:MAG TPA: hypothetical protein VK574_06845 [Terracidiphilus sp.]|jgi:hypothetical protein|nr:hypothetical protein [Terracidiphilus sp.]